MDKYGELPLSLRAELAERLMRAEIIEDDLRRPLEAAPADRAIDLADDEALAGVDEVLHREISDIRAALHRIGKGTYSTCTKCGRKIGVNRLKTLPTASRCVKCM